MSGIPFDARENRHVTFVREFANIVSLFQDKVDSLTTYHDEINKSVEDMKSCPYQIDKFEDALKKIQKLVSAWATCTPLHLFSFTLWIILTNMHIFIV
jgi:dynein heavy chain 1, cytosolic